MLRISASPERGQFCNSITLDLNHDERARDFFYREASVSQDPANSDRGLAGLVQVKGADGRTWYEAQARVIVWSAGPNHRLDTTLKSNQGDNQDNLMSWFSSRVR